MLDNLLEIEVAYSLLKSGDEKGKDPLDTHYEQLKTDMKVHDETHETTFILSISITSFKYS